MLQGEDPSPGDVMADAHWQLIAEAIPHVVWLASPDGRVEYLNQQANDYLGLSPEASL
ncbi:MAG: hypothetical protein QOD01_2711, partial [Actinomycetota bacterium]|nr:hypothetical protein [Actinomycetota bacterium]